jgi:very-short-patch-repair endonuclease
MHSRVACISAAKLMQLWVLETAALHVVPRVNNSHVRADGRFPPVTIHWSPSPIEPDSSRLVVESGRNALAHIADCQPLEIAVATFDSAVRKGMVSVEELRRLASVRGGRFARVVELVSTQADSGLESITRVRLSWEGIACREQVVIDGHAVDLLIGDRLIIQLDGRQHLEDPIQLARDRAQDRRLRRMGYTVLRYGYAEIVFGWETTWAEIRSHLAQRAHLA